MESYKLSVGDLVCFDIPYPMVVLDIYDCEINNKVAKFKLFDMSEENFINLCNELEG